MANQFLIKNTMQDMRNLSTVKIDGLEGNKPIYEEVQVLGYYEKGNTPGVCLIVTESQFRAPSKDVMCAFKTNTTHQPDFMQPFYYLFYQQAKKKLSTGIPCYSKTFCCSV